MPQSVTDAILSAISKSPVFAILFAIIVGGFKKWWVFGWQYADAQRALVDMKLERDEWRSLAFSGSHSVKTSVETTARIVEATKGPQ